MFKADDRKRLSKQIKYSFSSSSLWRRERIDIMIVMTIMKKFASEILFMFSKQANRVYGCGHGMNLYTFRCLTEELQSDTFCCLSVFYQYSRTSIIRTSIIRTIPLSRLFSLVPFFSWILMSCHLENLKLQHIILVRKWDEKFLKQPSMLDPLRVLWIS